MPRPKHEQPTPAELEVLQVLWDRGPATVREVMDALDARRPRAYTSVMSLLNVMTDKRLLKQTSRGRAFLYEARAEREKTLGRIVEDVLGRAFEGSASALVARLLDQASPSADELEDVRRAIDAYQAQQGDE